jgi:hypothetical protein
MKTFQSRRNSFGWFDEPTPHDLNEASLAHCLSCGSLDYFYLMYSDSWCAGLFCGRRRTRLLFKTNGTHDDDFAQFLGPDKETLPRVLLIVHEPQVTVYSHSRLASLSLRLRNLTRLY